MKSSYLFLLVYLLGNCFGSLKTQRDAACVTKETCGQVAPDSTSRFLRCVGLSPNDTGRDHMSRLKGMLEATMDVYTFMRSSATGVPLASLQGVLKFNPRVDPLQNEALVHMWMEVKMKPLLRSITKHFLSCLSTKKFSCSTYQTVVRELSHYFSEMNPVRQKWIYTFFMYPFLSGDRVSGCVKPDESSEDWLIKNFGAFSVMARMKDLTSLNMVFSGLEVLNLLSPAQKAELLLRPEVAGLDNSSLTLVFHSLLTGTAGPPPTMSPGGVHWTSPGYHGYHSPRPTHDLYSSPSPHNSLREVVNGFMMAFRPVGSFVHDFVSFTKERNVSEIRSTTLAQFLLNWTLAELADVYQPQHNTSVVQTKPKFDVTNVEDWYEQVVMPLLRRFLPNDQALMHENITLAFHEVFYLDHGKGKTNTSENQDVCSITLDKSPCGLTDAVENVAHVLHCAAQSNLTMTEATIMRLIEELTAHLNSLVKELSKVNFKSVLSDFREIFGKPDSPSLTQNHLEDENFIKLWFQLKLMPLLPDVPQELLSCLSTKNFSCPVYQNIVEALSRRIHFLDAAPMYSENIYKHFIYPFLLHHNNSDPHCMSTNQSAEWLKKNFGFFSRFASVADFYKLNPDFDGLEVLHLLSPQQIAEMLLLPLPTPVDVIDRVFDFLLERVEDKKFVEVLYSLVQLARKVHPPCHVYTQIFMRLYSAIPSVPVDVEPATWAGIDDLISMAPQECVPENITCPETKYNSTVVCRGVNSSDLQSYMSTSTNVPCTFTLEKYACAQLDNFTAHQLASVLMCDLPGNSSSSRVLWKMLLTKLSSVLDPALDILAGMATIPVSPSATEILDVIGEMRVSMLTDEQLENSSVVSKWFSSRLRGFLSSASGMFLNCLSHRNMSCRSYQQIVQILSHLQPHMKLSTQMSVTTRFMKVFLTRANTTDRSCSLNINNSGEWLQKNLGAFSPLVSFHDLRMLYSNFSAMEALPLLTVKQLAEASSTPGQLTSAAQVTMVMNHVPDRLLTAFFDDFSPAIAGRELLFPSEVRSQMLQVVFNRANLSDHSLGDSVVSGWLRNRLRPLLLHMSPAHVAPYFNILAGRNCSIEQQGVKDLNSSIFSLTERTQQEIHNHIIQTLKVPTPLRCYNLNHSFYSYLEASFLGFQFPNLTTFLSLMPPNNLSQLLNSIPPSNLGDFLRRADVVDNDEQLCVIYHNYHQTPVFLETEALPAAVRRPTLPCVWPMALRSSKRSEVNAWFDRRLQNYLVFLTKSLLHPDITHNTSCLAFQKLVSVLEVYNYNAADFTMQDVFDTISSYLRSEGVPRCYHRNIPELNSTAWFVEYIGPFMQFLTLEVLQTFGLAEHLQVFTVNPLNIALLNHSTLPLNLTNYYTELVYQENSNFNPLLLPLLCRCVAPGPAFSQLTANQSMIILHNLTNVCTDLDPQISAALAANLGSIDGSAISALGNESVGISTGQIKTIRPQVILASLTVLGNVMGWNQGQAMALIQSLMRIMQINNASSLFMLGSLVVGVPSTTYSSISGSQLLLASKNPSFVNHIVTAPQVIQKTFVTKIISVNSNSETIINNIPDEMATEIPRALLLGFSSNTATINRVNKKKWKRQQVELFFSVIGVESATAVLGSPNNLSSSVLQGFTCTGVRTFKKSQIRSLIKACRRRGRRKVALVETQLTCMYNYIRLETDATNFDLYPPDMLLYYDYSLVPQASCRGYFEQLAEADFSVFSATLGYKSAILFDNARSCLGITNTSLTEDNISVLGNMCCTLDGSYIENSDPSVLEKLKNCPYLTGAQAASVLTLLQSGKTVYGAPSTWNEQTLRNLEMLPLYMTSTFYDNFNRRTNRQFLRYFLKVLRRNKVYTRQIKRLRREIRLSNRGRSKRSIVNGCTVGEITQVTIADEAFPFDYDDVTQFNCCLSATTVKDNLASITEKVDDEEYLAVVLSKLQEAYGSILPEDVVQLLGPASSVATITDISMWSITKIDTLSALMDSSNGEWEPSSVKAVISKYLSEEGNQLGSAELNVIGGVNLCSLDVEVLKTISAQSLREADALTVSNCTLEKKKALFTIAREAFDRSTRSTVSATSFQLSTPYIGGAQLDYIQRLVASNVNMDMATFISLDESVVQDLSVANVKDLLGTNLPDLKSYENQTLVQNWISSRFQSDLDTLGLGLVGGRADPTTATPNTAATTTTTAPSNTVAPTTTTAPPATTTTSASTTRSTTKSNGARIRADAGLSFLVLLTLLITSQHIAV